jgi:iron(III) transport system substrate-binding protein
MRKSTWRLSTLGVLILLLVAACTPAPPTGGPAPSASGQGQPAGSDTTADPMARWNQTFAAAKTEGKVVVVTHTNLYYRDQIEKFQAKFPEIQVEHVAIRPSEFTPKVVTEQQNGVYGYDVWISPTSNMVETVVPAGGFQKLAPYLMLPEVTDPTKWRGGKLIYGTNNDEVFIFRPNVTGGVWVNRQVLPASEFNSIDQLVEPRFRGRIVMRTPDAPHNTSLTLTGILHSKGEAFVRQLLVDQQPTYIDNARLLTQNLISGRYPVALGTDNETLDACKREGGCTHLEEVRGYEYILGQGIGVLQNAPNPNAAAIFANWFLSKEGQQTWVDTVAATTPEPKDGAHTARIDVEPHPDAVKQATIPDYANLSKYSLQGMEQGGPEMQAVLNMYQQSISGGAR